jgi:Family of unknown function (DUF6152)
MRRIQGYVFPLAMIAGLVLGVALPVAAHHSFAVFFDDSKQVKVTGAVQEFQFRNPHGIIRLAVTDAAGTQQTWKAETNSPSILERRGWTRDSLKAGDVITIEGWPARDGSRYLRLRGAKRADGTAIGVPIAAAEEK